MNLIIHDIETLPIIELTHLLGLFPLAVMSEINFKYIDRLF